jgi:DNA polymerase-4
MNRIIFHVDVNSAYLSWEAIFRLRRGEKVDLRNISSIVSGNPKKRSGIVLAKSTPAKAYKIQIGETLNATFKKCPNLTVVPPNYNLYITASNAMLI